GGRIRDFLARSEITALEEEVEAKRGLLGSFQRDILLIDVQEKELQATLEKAKEKLESEPPYLKLRQSLFGSSEEEGMVGDFISGFLPLTIEREAVNEVYNALKGQVMSLEAQLSGMEARKKTMIEAAGEVQTELKELESTLLEKVTERDQLQREYDSALETYGALIQEYGKTQVYSMSEEVNAGVRIVSSALPPKEPISPRKMLNVAIAGVLGIFVGIIAAFVAEYWGKTAPSTEG
ncbi:MAG TPA: GNVR domain-containing protein, partial [Candidatus Atribacteria bacterium]|nr:GNVR domain-containing protein [Candidatus Atribacteria bacterium]